jgi:pimeloyl-ACP methyl ester carboxylesterase
MSTPLVLVGGAGLTEWIWDDLRERLPVDSAVGRYPSRRDAGLDDYADEVLSQVEWPTFTLVAHSLGGVVASQMVARAPERVAGFLAISACIPASGESFLGSLPRPQGLFMGLIVRVLGTKPPDKQIRSGLGAGLPADVAERIVTEFAAESRAVYRDRVSAMTFPRHRGYLFTTRDNQFSTSQQQRYARELDATWNRSIDTGHMPMLEDPDGLARVVTEFRTTASHAS